MRSTSVFLSYWRNPPRPRRSRRFRRATLLCESLESRQLLSSTPSTFTSKVATAQALLQVLPMAGQATSGYGPQQIDSAYGIGGISFSGVEGSGAGQTIAIVDAYNDPDIQSDLAAFDSHYGISAPPSFAVDNLGATATNSGWAVETSLDVEWAHAIAPEANIVLVEAPSASVSALLDAVSSASELPGVSVVSMSWGTSEFYGEWADEGIFTAPAGHTSETFVAASGDSGAWSGPTFPSVSPNVLAVGGTSLTLGSGNTYGSESGWSDSTGGFSGLDNDFRSSLPIPSYQVSTLTSAGLDYGIRTTPDVSFDANPDTGVAVFDSVPYDGSSGWLDVGGTSAAAPAWAGLVAITDQGLAASGKGTLSTTQLLTDLYALPSADYHDITSGFNGYEAGTGYDLVTGLGSPRANLLVPGLLAANGVTASSTTQTTTAATHQAASTSTVHTAAVVSSASTVTASIATTSTASPASSGIAALQAQSTTATSASAPAQQATASSTTAVNASGTSVGLGQGLSSPGTTAGQSDGTDSGSSSPESSDVIKDRPAVDRATPEMSAPAPEWPAPETTAPELPPGTPPADEDPSTNPMPLPFFSTRERQERTLDRLIAEVYASRQEASTGREQEAAAVPDHAEASLAGLVAAGAVAAFGHRAVLGRSRRRRPLSAAFRSPGR